MAHARQRARRGDSMTVSGRQSRAAEGAKAVGRGQPFHTALPAGVALFQPKKLVCWTSRIGIGVFF